jgi:hypothetical protein
MGLFASCSSFWEFLALFPRKHGPSFCCRRFTFDRFNHQLARNEHSEAPAERKRGEERRRAATRDHRITRN